MPGKTLTDVISAYGAKLKPKLANIAIGGARGSVARPLEVLLHDLAAIGGLSAGSVHLVGETTLADLKTRPDFAVTVSKALVGFIEVKAPGKGADPRKFNDCMRKPSGTSSSRCRTSSTPTAIRSACGATASSKARLSISTAMWRLQVRSFPRATLLPLINDFLRWSPIPPKTAKQLAQVSARLCRLLRDEVIEQMARSSPGLTGLAKDWRKLLFPQADDAQFADGYAQAVTFGLLVARARDISLSNGTEKAAQELRKTNSLIGTALRLLTDDSSNQEALKRSLGTLTRVLDAVDWHTISKDKSEAWLYFYEDFLEVYDNTLRKRTGSYYTPPQVVEAMVNLVDEALRGPLFERGGLCGVRRGRSRSGRRHRNISSWRAAPHKGDGHGRSGRWSRARCHRGRRQAHHRLRNTIRPVRGGAAPIDCRAVGADECTAFAGASSVHHRYARQSVHRGGDPRTTLRAVAKSRRDANKVKKEQRITVVIGNRRTRMKPVD